MSRLEHSHRILTLMLLLTIGSPMLAKEAEVKPALAVEAISTAQFTAEAAQFLKREITAHAAGVTNLNPPQQQVLGVPTQGDFSWGSLMRAIAECSALSGERTIAGRDVPEFLGKLGLIEARQGGKTFAQLGAALSLRQFGTDLRTNLLWQSLSPEEQMEWRSLLNPERFYDIKTHHVIDLPENYMGVASRIATMDYQMGIITNRLFAEEILERAADQFLKGALYTDDNLPTGRFDRYSQEYARFVYEAAQNIGRQDIQAAVKPSLEAVIRTWWALVAPDGYGYPWGRTIGDMSYIDSMEIVGFLAQHPEYRPAPLQDLASVYYAAWQAVQRDYQPDRHLLNMFGFGRGSYSYMTVARQWQQTTAYLAKSANSLRLLTVALKAENIAEFPAKPQLPMVARFDFFRKGDRPAGAWLVRQKQLRFALPITTGPRPGIADYLPAPHGLPGFAAPVQQLLPALVPYLELEDGRIISASDGADEIHPDNDGKGLQVLWKRWALVRDASGKYAPDIPYGEAEKLMEPGLTTQVTWRIEDGALIRTEKITAEHPVRLRKISLILPCSGDRVSTSCGGEHGIYQFTGSDAKLTVSITSSGFRFAESLQATGDSVLGKGTRGPIPIILQLQATDLVVRPEKSLVWSIKLQTLAP